MRFACQSCGKAYNLPEEKIADKSNVKLKCRVCGAIVEVKRQGELVAQVLAEVEGKRGRVSEAPAPLTSMSPDDADDETHAIAVGDQILAETSSSPDAAAAALLGHVKSALSQQRGLVPLPPPPPTGFGSSGFGSGSATSGSATSGSVSSGLGSGGFGSGGFGANALAPGGFGAGALGTGGFGSGGFGTSGGGAPPSTPLGSAALAPFGANSAPVPSFGAVPPGATPIPPPLSMPEPPSHGRAEPPVLPSVPASPNFAEAFGSPPPPPLPGGEPLHNGSNGMVPRFGDMAPLPDELSPVATLGTMSAATGEFPQVSLAPLPTARAGDDTTRKMLAALATGILIGFIIARLFF
jgi:hypothetical protein